MTELRDTIYRLLEADNPMTVRQVFYRLTTMGAIGKTEAEYKQTVVRLLGIMRRDGQIPFGWIADSTRWMRKPRTHSSMHAMLAESTRTYRRAIWDDQDVYVEIWLEKEALAGVLVQETAQWDVPLMVTRGYPSLSYLFDAAETMRDQGKPAHLFYFGDHDPSGVDINRTVERDLREFAPDVDLHFERVAVTRQQIEEMNLPTRPTKTTDSRSRSFDGESVEVDAIPPAELRRLVRERIEIHIDKQTLARTKRVEAAERETLAMFVSRFNEEGGA